MIVRSREEDRFTGDFAPRRKKRRPPPERRGRENSGFMGGFALAGGAFIAALAGVVVMLVFILGCAGIFWWNAHLAQERDRAAKGKRGKEKGDIQNYGRSVLCPNRADGSAVVSAAAAWPPAVVQPGGQAALAVAADVVHQLVDQDQARPVAREAAPDDVTGRGGQRPAASGRAWESHLGCLLGVLSIRW